MPPSIALLMPGLDETAALALARAIRNRILDAPLPLADGGSLTLTASLGLVVVRGGDLPEDKAALDHLPHAADEALYEAKAMGRNRVTLGRPTIPANPRTAPLGGLSLTK